MSPYGSGLRAWLKKRLEVLRWRLAGRPIPIPRLVKDRRLLREMDQGSYAAFVETGTYMGETVRLAQGKFPKVISIEVEPKIHADAQKAFAQDPSVEILLGDSGEVMKAVVARPELAAKPVLFWLDGHYSGGVTGKGSLDTPILQELATLLTRSCGDRILIDDAHMFEAGKDYPTVEALRQWVAQRRPELELKVADNIIALEKAGPA